MIKDKAKFEEVTLFHENRKQKLIDAIAHEKNEIEHLCACLDRGLLCHLLIS